MTVLRVSQRNVEHVLGIDARRYLELLRRHAIAHARVGKLRLAKPEDVLAAIERTEIAAEAEGVDGVLAAVGLRATRGAR